MTKIEKVYWLTMDAFFTRTKMTTYSKNVTVSDPPKHPVEQANNSSTDDTVVEVPPPASKISTCRVIIPNHPTASFNGTWDYLV